MANGSERAAIAMGWLKDNGGVVAIAALLVGAMYHSNWLLAEKIDAVDAKLTDKIDALDAKLTDKIDAVDAKLTARIDAVDAKLTVRIDAVDARVGRLEARVGRVEERLSEDIRALREQLRAAGAVAPYGGAIDKRVPLPVWRLLPLRAAAESQARDWSSTVPAALVGNVLTLYPDDRDSEMTALLQQGGWRPADPADPAAGLVLRKTAP